MPSKRTPLTGFFSFGGGGGDSVGGPLACSETSGVGRSLGVPGPGRLAASSGIDEVIEAVRSMVLGVYGCCMPPR